MKVLRMVPRAAALSIAGAVLAAGVAFAQAPKGEYQPEVGQQGKDVVWVPTSQSVVNKMLELAKAGPADFVMDLGSGDGRTVITAAKLGAKAMGIEYNPDMVELSRRNAAAPGAAPVVAGAGPGPASWRSAGMLSWRRDSNPQPPHYK